MKITYKQKTELIDGENFMLMLGCDPDDCFNGPDPPDIVLKIKEKRIGLEITKVVNNYFYKKYASYQDLIKDIELEYSQRFPGNNFHLYISLNFFEICKMQKKYIIKRFIKAINDYIEFSTTETDFFSRIEICAWNTKEFRIFPFYGAGYELSVPENLVEKAVRKKELDIHRYRSLYDECWLLITLPLTFSCAADYSLPDYTEQPLSNIKSEFDRVFIMGNNKIEYLK